MSSNEKQMLSLLKFEKRIELLEKNLPPQPILSLASEHIDGKPSLKDLVRIAKASIDLDDFLDRLEMIKQ